MPSSRAGSPRSQAVPCKNAETVTILLTAANGRTGRAVLTQLSKTGANVKAFLRDERQWPALEQLGAASYVLIGVQ